MPVNVPAAHLSGFTFFKLVEMLGYVNALQSLLLVSHLAAQEWFPHKRALAMSLLESHKLSHSQINALIETGYLMQSEGGLLLKDIETTYAWRFKRTIKLEEPSDGSAIQLTLFGSKERQGNSVAC